MYQIKDSIGIFTSKDNSIIRVEKFYSGYKVEMKYSESLIKLFKILENPVEEDEILKKLPRISKRKVNSTLNELIKLGIIEREEKNNRKRLSILLLGCGTIGSHIYSQVSKLENIDKIILIDPDKVEDDNIERQDFYKDDVGKYKVDVLKNRCTNKNVCVHKKYIKNIYQLKEICIKNNCNFIIGAADIPSSREISEIICEVGNSLNIPYIINHGYVSNVVMLPEFYYPNCEYAFKTNRIFSDRFNQQVLTARKKLEYSKATNLALIVSKQIELYAEGYEPIYYKKRGFFNDELFRWEER